MLPLARRHAARLQCRRGCHACCIDGLTVFEVEANRIRERHGTLLTRGLPHPEGACAFLGGDGACRIYEDRPYVCRTQGLPLRWFERDGAGREVELRDICPLNEIEDEPLETLSPADCWTVGPAEGRLAALQRDAGAALRRIPLRSLFRRKITACG